MIDFDESTASALYAALKTSFPDAKVGPPELMALAACVLAERSRGNASLPPALSTLDLGPYESSLAALAKEGAGTPSVRARTANDETLYYWIQATHTRRSPVGFDPFVGELAMARVRLPERVPTPIETAIGDVLPGDHLIDTVFEANQKYASTLGYELERVDCVTPTREGVRFGAISVMLGYRGRTDPAPSCYILEAGTATGQPKVLYFGATLDTTIDAYSGYQPTPFACPTHAYRGRLTMDGDHPLELAISSRKVEEGTSQPPYIDVTVAFRQQQGDVSQIWPGFLIARAAMIVLLREWSGKIENDCAPNASPAGEGDR